MRLCGISSRFQLLSPCMRQVAHALLTRPPLSHIICHPERIQSQASFDLHVLSTPPAFILSQDQTLMLKSSFPPESSGFDKPRFIPFKPGSSESKRLYCFKGLPIFQSGNVRVLFYSTLKFFESFKVISLFSYQGSFTLQAFCAVELLQSACCFQQLL